MEHLLGLGNVLMTCGVTAAPVAADIDTVATTRLTPAHSWISTSRQTNRPGQLARVRPIADGSPTPAGPAPASTSWLPTSLGLRRSGWTPRP